MGAAFITLHFGFRFVFLFFALWCTGWGWNRIVLGVGVLSGLWEDATENIFIQANSLVQTIISYLLNWAQNFPCNVLYSGI
jgi:hypothetical protein